MNSPIKGPRGSVYSSIQNHPLSLSERDAALAFDKARFDPRLMEIMTEFIRDFWWAQNPQELNKAARKTKNPFMLKAAVLVIFDRCEIPEHLHKRFIEWMKLVISGIQDPAPQLMYVGLIPVGSKTMKRELDEAIPIFFEHNLICKDLPFNKGQPGFLKSEETPQNRVSSLDLMKLKLVKKIKDFKFESRVSNQELCRITGINRLFLCKILNNKTSGITIEYLNEKAKRLPK